MILTCPNCATSYEIADDSVGAAGRNVRCAACKTMWHAQKPEEPIELPLSAAADPKPVDKKPAEVKAKELPKLYRTMLVDKKRAQALAAQGMIWGGLAAVFVAILGLSYFLRVDIVRAFPGVANAYAMAGLKVNAAGLEFVNYKVEPAFKGGRFVVSVHAEVKNLRDEDTPVPPVRAKILDGENRTVSTILVPSNGLVVAPNATRTLVFDVPDARNMASSVELMFDLVAMKTAAKAKPAQHASAGHKPQGHALPADGHGEEETGHAPAAADHAQQAADPHAVPDEASHEPAADAHAEPVLKPALPSTGDGHAPPPLKTTPHH